MRIVSAAFVLIVVPFLLGIFPLARAQYPAAASLILHNGYPVAPAQETVIASQQVGATEAGAATPTTTTAKPSELQFPESAITVVPAKPTAKPTTASGSGSNAESKTSAALWPKNTVEIFTAQCARGRPAMIVPCQCTIIEVMKTIPYDEFMRLSTQGSVENDPRYTTARATCATKPKQREQ